MSQRPDTDDYRRLLLSDTPMMDMRSPGEFTQGAFPAAHSLPLMTNDERAAVGTCYKREGQDAAIALGHRLVSGEVRHERLAAWLDFAREHPDGYLYCFRGGLRSRTVQQWLREQGVNYPLVLGGYKAMRRFLIDELQRSVERASIVLISGRTGTGKTRVIGQIPRSVDLEGIAAHRGSTFGQLPQGQPSQIDFENTLSVALMKLLSASEGALCLEDEGRLIGRLYLPQALRAAMGSAPILEVEHSLDERIDVIIDDYVVDLGRRYSDLHGREDGALKHEQKLQADLWKIRKRLGSERQTRVSSLMTDAFAAQRSGGGLTPHRDWIYILLAEYYDPMYDYQLSQRSGEILFQGPREHIVRHALEMTSGAG
ncbi:MAG: tRNA 2-selenouridine(34) synthase MnmH [Pseudomonadota bacterium]